MAETKLTEFQQILADSQKLSRAQRVIEYLSGMSLSEVAAKHGVSAQRIQQQVAREGIDAVEVARLRRLELLKTFVSIWNSSSSRLEVMKRTGLSSTGVANRCMTAKKTGFVLNKLPSGRKSASRPRTQEILNRFNAGIPIADIASDMGMREATVRHAIYMHNGTSEEKSQ